LALHVEKPTETIEMDSNKDHNDKRISAITKWQAKYDNFDRFFGSSKRKTDL